MGYVLGLFHDDMTRLLGMNAFNWFLCPISFFYLTFSLPPSVHPPSRATIAANAAAITRFSLMFPEKSRHRGEVMHDLLLYNPGSAGGPPLSLPSLPLQLIYPPRSEGGRARRPPRRRGTAIVPSMSPLARSLSQPSLRETICRRRRPACEMG